LVDPVQVHLLALGVRLGTDFGLIHG
jgi:hypothetical protein